MDKTFILVLEDSRTQLEKIKYILNSAGFYIIPFSNPVAALNYLNSKESILPDLILSDINMPVMDGYEFCKHVKSNLALKDIPLIFLTALLDDDNQAKGFDVGAVDYIFKPINAELIRRRIQMHCELKMHQLNLEELVNKKIKELELLQEITIECIANLAEYRDNETGAHIKRTREYIKVLVNELKKFPKYREYLTDSYVKLLYQSAPLHDIGKVGIPDSILLKPGSLTKDEFDIMKYHTLIGKKTLEIADAKMNKESFLHYAIEMAAAHHEKWDGTGYPLGLKGEEIPLIARLMAVADVYDALVSKRVYKDAISHEDAVAIIKTESGKQFDPDIVSAFLNVEQKIKEILKKYADNNDNEGKKTLHDNCLDDVSDKNKLGYLPNCWEILKCGAEKCKDKKSRSVVCPAYGENMGHSCWIVAGLFAENGNICNRYTESKGNCLLCEVYKRYSRSDGVFKQEVLAQYPDENRKYYKLIKNKSDKNN